VLRLSIFGTFRVADASGKEIPVKSRKSRALLAYLALPPGKPRSREQIMALLWSDRGDQQARSSLRQALSGLRRELGEERLSALRITDEALTLDPEQVLVEPASPGDVLLDGLHLNDPAFDEWLRDERLRHEGGSEPDPLPPGLSLPDKPSIAVLPFTNMSGDPEQEYFSDGITEDIITELSRFRSLFVIARNSSFTFKGQAVDLSEVAKRLGVRYILEGSVRRAANRVRITAQLIEAANQNHLWSERYDGQLEDIFSLQDDISERVVWALVGHLEQAETIKAKRSGTVDPTAYDVMLRAFDQLVRYTPDDTAEAIRLMESVVATTPKSGMALSRLAAAYQLKYWWTGDLEWTRRAEEAANAALELGDNEESTEALLAYCAAIRGDFARAERHMERALANNPHNRHTMYYHMSIQNIRGHPEAEGTPKLLLKWPRGSGGWIRSTQPISMKKKAMRSISRAATKRASWRLNGRCPIISMRHTPASQPPMDKSGTSNRPSGHGAAVLPFAQATRLSRLPTRLYMRNKMIWSTGLTACARQGCQNESIVSLGSDSD
jgi:TolB-like protein